MDCFICDQPRTLNSPVCLIHRGIAMARWGYGSQPVELRVAGRCTIIGDCWLYHKHDEHGYSSKVMVNGSRTAAHRAILLAVRPPNDLTLDATHLCPNRQCCNPAHLVWLTRKENVATRIMPFRPYNPTCSRCKDNPKAVGQSWCQPCFNAYYRERRKVTKR